MYKLSLIVLSLIILSGCVSKKKYVELSLELNQCETKYTKLKKDKEILDRENKRLDNTIAALNSQIKSLKRDTAVLGNAMRKKEKEYQLLNESYEMMVQKTNKKMRGKEKEIIELQNNLLQATQKIKDRESELLLVAQDLHEQRKEFNKIKDEFNKAREELNEKEAKLIELQTVLNRQDSVVNALKNKVSKTFLGYEDKGLNVELKNGKVYVSLEEKLLFATGSTNVNKNGEEALKKLSKILEEDTTINVMVEGHTDDIPYKAPVNGIKDNWDLSVMRATTVVRIILKHGEIEPQRIIPSGRGPYVPVEEGSSPEVRAKNRRIEIILTPQLDELFQIIETN